MKIITQMKSFAALANKVLDNITEKLAEQHRKAEASELLSYAKSSHNSKFAQELIADGATIRNNGLNLQSMRAKVFSQTPSIERNLSQKI